MDEKFNNNIFLVPLIAVLMIYTGLTNGGTNIKIIDFIIYIIAVTLSYTYIYFYKNYLDKDKYSIIMIYLLSIILFILSWKINKFLVVPIFLQFVHLIYFTKTKKIENITTIKSIISFTYENIPFANKIIFISILSIITIAS